MTTKAWPGQKALSIIFSELYMHTKTQAKVANKKFSQHLVERYEGVYGWGVSEILRPLLEDRTWRKHMIDNYMYLKYPLLPLGEEGDELQQQYRKKVDDALTHVYNVLFWGGRAQKNQNRDQSNFGSLMAFVMLELNDLHGFMYLFKDLVANEDSQ